MKKEDINESHIKNWTGRVILFIIIVLYSCSDNRDLRRDLEKMYSKPIILRTDEMWRWDPNFNCYEENRCDAEIKMVIYVDSLQCSTCYLESLELWNDYLCIEQKSNGKIKFIFIFESRIGLDTVLYQNMHIANLKHSMYIDTKHLTRICNPHLSDKMMLHTFVLDKRNNVLLVGNPLYNEHIEQLFLKTASQYISENVKLDSLGHIVFENM